MKVKATSGIMLTLLLMGMLFASFRVNETLASPEVRFYVKMPNGYIPGVPPGDLVNGPFPGAIEIWIDTDVPIVTWEISLAWDPTVIQYGWELAPGFDFYYAEGTFLSDWDAANYGQGTSLLEGAVDMPGGTISGMICSINKWTELPPELSGPSGSGLLVTLYFTSLSATDYSIIDLIDEVCYIYTKTTPAIPADIVEDGHYNPPPPVHNLTVESTPIDGIDFTIDSGSYATNATVELAEGSYTVTMPPSWTVGPDQYNFVEWEDASTSLARSISLTSDMTIVANYELQVLAHNLTVESTPIDGVDFTIDSGSYATNVTVELAEGSYTVTMPPSWTVGPDQYNFVEWEDASTSLARSISLTSDMTIVANYELLPPQDVTPPEITIDEPVAKDYLHSENMTLDFSAVDTESGLASISATLDGEVVESGDSFELFNRTLGKHTLTVTAVDNAGNSATETVEFNVIATVGSLQDLVNMFFELGYFYSPKGMLTSLIHKLYAAETYIDAGQIDDAKGVLGAFINHLEAQSGKHVSDYAANILIADAEYVINNL
jgi:hypothetical protein